MINLNKILKYGLFFAMLILTVASALGACYTPTADNNVINVSTVLCTGTYNIADSDDNGVFQINGTDITLNGNNSMFIGAGSGKPFNFSNKDGTIIYNMNIKDYSMVMLIDGNTRFESVNINSSLNYSIDAEVTIKDSNIILYNDFDKMSRVRIGDSKKSTLNITNSTLKSNSSEYEYMFSTGFDYSNLYISDSYFYGMNKINEAIFVIESGNATISNSIFNNSRGLVFDGKSRTGFSYLIYNNTFIDNAYPIGYRRSGNSGIVTEAHDNRIYSSNNQGMSGISCYGIYFESVWDFEIYNNYIETNCTGGYAIDGTVADFNNVSIHDNEIVNYGNVQYIVVARDENSSIYNNILTGQMNKSGISIGNSDNNVVYNNTINVTLGDAFDEGYCIQIYGNSNNTRVYNNTFDGCYFTFRNFGTQNEQFIYNNTIYNTKRYDHFHANTTLNIYDNIYSDGLATYLIQDNYVNANVNENSADYHLLTWSGGAIYKFDGNFDKNFTISNVTLRATNLASANFFIPASSTTVVFNNASFTETATTGYGYYTTLTSSQNSKPSTVSTLARNVEYSYTASTQVSFNFTGTGATVIMVNATKVSGVNGFYEALLDSVSQEFDNTASYTFGEPGDWLLLTSSATSIKNNCNSIITGFTDGFDGYADFIPIYILAIIAGGLYFNDKSKTKGLNSEDFVAMGVGAILFVLSIVILITISANAC